MRALVRPWATFSSFSRIPANGVITPLTSHFRLSLPNSFALFSPPRLSMATASHSAAQVLFLFKILFVCYILKLRIIVV